MNDSREVACTGVPSTVTADGTRKKRALRGFLAMAIWLAAIYAGSSLYSQSRGYPGFDFYTFWVGGDVLRTRAPGEKIDFYSDAAFTELGKRYGDLAQSKSRRQRDAAAIRPVVTATSSPFFYWVFSVVTHGDYDRDYRIYQIACFACLIGAGIAIGRRLGYSAAGIGAAVALAILSEPVVSDFRVANINCPELAVVVAYLLLRDRGRKRSRFAMEWTIAAGAVMGLLIAFKANLLLVPALLWCRQLFSRDYRVLAAEIAAAAASVIFSVVVSSWSFGGLFCWIAWVECVRSLAAQPSMPSGYGNISLSRTLFELTGHDFTGLLALVAIAAALGATWIGRQRSARSQNSEFRHDLALLAIGGSITFLVSGLAWMHYPILLFPFLLLAAAPPAHSGDRRGDAAVRYALAAAAIALLLFPPSRDIQAWLPVHIRLTPMMSVRACQAAVLIILPLGMWFELRLLPKRARDSDLPVKRNA